MAKSGKITVHIADYNNVAHYISLMGMEDKEEKPQQIGQEVLIPIKFKDLTQVFKLGGNSKLAIPVIHKATEKTPAKVDAVSKTTKK